MTPRGRARPKAADTALEQVERAMVRIRRSQSKRTLGRLMTSRFGIDVDFATSAVVDAVEEGPEPEGRELTVGLVAERLSLDPSRASRVVAAAVQDGYVARVASQADGRRISLELTAKGRELATSMHDGRRRVFAETMSDWSERERREFARLLTRFVEGDPKPGPAD